MNFQYKALGMNDTQFITQDSHWEQFAEPSKTCNSLQEQFEELPNDSHK